MAKRCFSAEELDAMTPGWLTNPVERVGPPVPVEVTRAVTAELARSSGKVAKEMLIPSLPEPQRTQAIHLLRFARAKL